MEQGSGRVGRTILVAGILIAALVSGAAYGFFLHRNHLFPYHLVRDVSRRVDKEGAGSTRFRIARPDRDTPLSLDTIKQLANLPYLQGYRPATAGGAVRLHVPKLAQDGLNLFTSGHAPVATLIDMDGKVVKTWTVDAQKAFPDFQATGFDIDHTRFFSFARLLPDGGILAMFDQVGLVRLDASSRLLWAYRARVHHEVFLDPAGTIWVLTREMRLVPELRSEERVFEDFVNELAPDGRFLRRVSLLEAFRHSDFAPLLVPLPYGSDIFHTNSIEVFDGSLAARSPFYKKGNILFSTRHLDTIGILDPAEGRIVWALRGQWHTQHCARLLANGHMILFDNFGTMRAASRVLEFDPFTQQILWRFGEAKGEDLYSETFGRVQRLSNGNTLIVESNFGRAIEVTPDHHIVWEFVNPNRAGKKKALVATLYCLERVPRDLAFLKPTASAAVSGQGAPR